MIIERLQVLLVSSDTADSDLIRESLSEPGAAEIEILSNLPDALARARTGGLDVLLVDPCVSGGGDPEVVGSLRNVAPGVPLIALVGADDPDLALASMKNGAWDCLVKGRYRDGVLASAARHAAGRGKAERDLHELRQVMDSLTRGVGEGIMLLSEDLNVLWANDIACIKAGKTRDGMIGGQCYRLTHQLPGPCSPPDDICPVERVRSTGQAVTVLHRHRDDKGNVIPTEVTAFPIRDETGRITRFVHISRDVTERREAEMRERLAHDVLHMLNRSAAGAGDTIRDILLLIRERVGIQGAEICFREGEPGCAPGGRSTGDRQGDPLLDSMSARIVSGQTDTALPYFTPGGSFWTNRASELLAPDSGTDIAAGDRNRLHPTEYESAALVPLRSEGGIIGLVRLTDPRPGRFSRELIRFLEGLGESIGIALSRRKAEEALADTQRRLESVLTTTGTGIVVVDVEFGLQYVDPGWQKKYGDPHGRKCHEYFAGSPRLCPGCAAQRAIETRKPQITERTLPCENNRPVEVHTIPFQDSTGNWRLVAELYVDMSERKKAERELREIREQFLQAQKMEAVGKLAGGVAHDFNNLLTVINGYSQILVDGMGPADPTREILTAILHAGERAAALTRQLLAFGRKQVLQPQTLDLNRQIRDMQEMLTRLVGEDVEVRLLKGPDPMTVRADPHQVGQVLMNLVVNSRDAMPRGGRVTIATAIAELDDRQALSHPEARAGRYVMVSVSDTGTGMSEDTRRHLFEPFFTTKGAGKGTGLGLSTVHGIVIQSGGHIRVRSEAGQGSTFEVYLPWVEPATIAGPPPPGPDPALEGKESILVVEDQPEVRNFTAAALRTYGYRVLTAGSAGEAAQIFTREMDRIALVLTDVVMPVDSGRVLADHIRQIRPGTRILYMSGYAEGVISHGGALSEGVAFIQKPFLPAGLAAVVRKMLDE